MPSNRPNNEFMYRFFVKHFNLFSNTNTTEAAYTPLPCRALTVTKTARVMGKLALNPPKNGERVSGLLVQKDFGHMIIAPEDLHEYTRLKTAKLIQKQKVPTTQKMGALRFALEALFEGIHTVSSWDPDAAPEAEPEPKKLEEITAGEAIEEAPASPTKATRGKKKAATSPAKGKKGAEKKEEPAEETVVKKEEAPGSNAGREGSPEPPGLSVNGGQLTILKRPETKKYGAEHALLQWDDVSNEFQANVRLDWIHTPGSDLFLVLDTGYLTGALDDPRDTRWLRRTGVVKLTYLRVF